VIRFNQGTSGCGMPFGVSLVPVRIAELSLNVGSLLTNVTINKSWAKFVDLYDSFRMKDV